MDFPWRLIIYGTQGNPGILAITKGLPAIGDTDTQKQQRWLYTENCLFFGGVNFRRHKKHFGSSEGCDCRLGGCLNFGNAIHPKRRKGKYTPINKSKSVNLAIHCITGPT